MCPRKWGKTKIRVFTLLIMLFFTCFEVKPSGSVAYPVLRGQVSGGRGIVGTELEPSSSLAAYLTFALSRSVSLSTVFVHVLNARCFSREECRWKLCVQPSFGHGNTWSLVQSFKFDKVSHVWIFRTCTTSPPKKRSKATDWHHFLFMLWKTSHVFTFKKKTVIAS